MALQIEYLTGDGDDYPLIRIFGRDPATVCSLIAVIKGLTASGPPDALHAIDGVEALNCSLSAIISEREPGGVRPNGNDNSFLWVLSDRRRQAIIDLLGPFESPSPHNTFQWLSGSRAIDDADRGVGLVITTDDLGRW